MEAVDKNPAHARELVRKDLARQAVVELVAQQQRPRAAAESTERRKPPDIWERGAAAFRQEVGREIHAVTHPTEALAEYIHNRRTWPGGGRLARANDIVGGSLAGMAADTIEGVGELGDLYRRYGQGGIIEDALAKRGLIAPPLEFGIRPQQVRDLLGVEFISKMQNQFATHPRDYFLKVGVFADYDDSSRLEVIEFAEPAEAVLDGADMLEMNFDRAVAFLKARDPATVVESDGATSYAAGVAIWTPLGDEGGDEPIKTVLVFREGYYDR